MTNPRVADWTVQAISRVVATFAILQGINIIVGGSLRWSADVFTVALKLPGAPASWGVALIATGLLALGGSLLHRPRPTSVGLFLTGMWAVFFAVAFGSAALTIPEASTTGFWAYGTIALISIILAAAYHNARS